MTNRMTTAELDGKLSRIRESCIFYLKLDLAMLAAIATIASVLKLDGTGLMMLLTRHRQELNILAGLIIFAVIFELALLYTRTNLLSPRTTSGVQQIVVSAFSYAYAVQVLGHIFLIVGLFSYLAGVLNCLSDVAKCLST